MSKNGNTGATNLPAFKTSIRKSANKVASGVSSRASINLTAEASPNLRGQKRKSKEQLPDPPAEKRMTSSQDLATALTGITARLDKIDQGLQGNASKQDVTNVQNTLTGIRDQVERNTDDIQWLMQQRKEDEDGRKNEIERFVHTELNLSLIHI